MKWKAVAALVLVAGGVALGVSSLREYATPYVGFAEARRTGGLVQVSGRIVDRDSIAGPDGRTLSFRLRDRQGEVLPVIYHGVVPPNFTQTTMVVVVGRCRGGRFEARRLLVKCPSKYQPEAVPPQAGP